MQQVRELPPLLDAGSFVEIGGGVTARATDFNMQKNRNAGRWRHYRLRVIDGNLVYVYSQDASVLGGSIGEMHAKKIAALYDMAMKMGAPVIGLVDCAGIRLQEATDALDGFGKLYLKQSMASGVIPQITAIFGNCGGGLAVIPALTDFTFMETEHAKLFVNSPNAIGKYCPEMHYRAFWQRRCRAAAAGAVLKPQGGNCAVHGFCQVSEQ